MLSWLTLLGMGGTAVAALGFALTRFRPKRPSFTRATMHLLGAAQRDAEQRGHRPLTVTHVALALLADPTVAEELESRGISLQDLFDDVERLLPQRGESPVTLALTDVEPAVHRILRRSTGRPLGMLQALLQSDVDSVKAVFARHGVSATRWPPPVEKSPARSDSNEAEAGPYRSPATEEAASEVVFWNDDKTPQEFVTAVLRETFGIVEPRATRLVLSVDQKGCAVVGTYGREEALRLAQTTTRQARERGFPLRVSVEQAGTTAKMSRIRRWFL